MHSTRSQPQVIKFTSCLQMIGGSLRRLPPLKTGRHYIDEILLKVALSTIHQSINITQQLKHLITMCNLFCRMHSHYLHKTLGQSYYPTAEDFHYHVRQSIEMFNKCSRRKGLRACLYDSDLYKKMRVSSPLLYGFEHHLFLYLCCDLVCLVCLFVFFHLLVFVLSLVVHNVANASGLCLLDCSFGFL